MTGNVFFQIQQLSAAQDDCRKKNQQLTLLKRSGEKRATESKREYQLALLEVERKVETAELLVLDYREFLMVCMCGYRYICTYVLIYY